MRAGALREALALCALVGFTAFCVFDEEPVLDFGDWSCTQVLLLVGCFLVVVFELAQRMRWGQFVQKDQTVLFAALTFWFGLENYARAVVIIFCVHCLTPLEVELFELAEVQHALCVWVGHELLPATLLLGAVLVGHRYVAGLVGTGRRVALALGLCCVCAVQLVCWLVLSWDLLLSGLSGFGITAGADVFYLQPRTGLTYDQHAGASDQFEWHREHTQPFVLRFEDLYVFTLQLFNCLGLGLCLCVWLLLLVDLAQQRVVPSSHTAASLGRLFLEHVCAVFLVSYASVACVSSRLALRDPLEFAFGA